ncbi:MAG: DUF4886 domain-containing protein [Lentisphaeria bacterium]|nr:DUF4886 domain-containing protein [Lentisphaeria bacterium]
MSENFAKEIKMLNVGNSFTWSLEPYFRDMVAAEGKHGLVQWHCSMGGCELSRHWSYVERFEKSGERIYTWETLKDGTAVMISLKEALLKEKWDIVTIQQASHESWREDTYQPYGAKLIEDIRQYAPQAQIVVQQTWAYRADCPRLTKEWKITQQEMYDKLTEAYKRFCREMGLPRIPVGDAVQLARQQQAQPEETVDPENAWSDVKYPDNVSEPWQFVGGINWYKDPKTGEYVKGRDFIHLNARGRYLQALVWYGYFFGENPAEVKYLPDDLKIEASDAEFLREIASEVLKNTPKLELHKQK